MSYLTNLSDNELQDVARSSYADMLNDDERNRAYDQAIRICVRTLVQSPDFNPRGEKFFKCCDIGTGSGLLSMMIVRAFKEINYHRFSVTAFESFEPMATCAQQIINRAGMLDYITVIPQSSDLVDENPSFDLLVAELLDTELIGEGCLATYRHAVECLCSPICLFVPHEARIYIEPIASETLFRRHALHHISLPLRNENRITVEIPSHILKCSGLAAIDDMQVSALKEGHDFSRISEPKIAFIVNFGSVGSLCETDSTELKFPIHKKVTEPVVMVMWWDIVMYDKDRVSTSLTETFPINLEILSCAPTWARSQELLRRDGRIREIYKRDVWREHWIQGIYYFSDVTKTRQLTVRLDPGSVLPVYAYRDSHSLWFELDPISNIQSNFGLPENCSCGVHRALSRSQISFLNDLKEMKKLFESLVGKKQNTSFTGKIQFISRPLGVRTIPVEDAPKWYINIEGMHLIDLSINDELPWEKVMVRHIEQLSIAPVESFVVQFTQVYFENLNRIRTKVKTCEGFDLEPLDNMIGQSASMIDNAFESHHLWEYGGRRLDHNHVICSPSIIYLERARIRAGTYKQNYRLPIKNCMFEYKRGWALVFWVELKLQHTNEVISSGPVESLSGDTDEITWNRHCKQIVYFMHDFELTPYERERQELSVDIYLKDCYPDIKFVDRFHPDESALPLVAQEVRT